MADEDVVARIDALSERVAALEARLERPRADDAAPVDGLDPERFWALRGLKERLDHDGGVLLTGSVRLPGHDEVGPEWQQGARTAELLESDWSDAATPLAALGHPVRLQVLQAILGGTTTTTELADLEALGTRGQLHHHLRELTAAGWLRSVGRGVYEVPGPRIIPLLVTITGAWR